MKQSNEHSLKFFTTAALALGAYRDLKISGRRGGSENVAEFAFFQSSSRLIQVTNFFKCW